MLLSVDRSRGEERPLSLAIVEAIAEREGVEPTEIEPPQYQALYEVCNPEALDALFARREDGTPRGDGRIELRFCGYDLVVTSDGEVTIRDESDDSA